MQNGWVNKFGWDSLKTLGALLLLAAVSLALGALYNSGIHQFYRWKYPAPGGIYKVNGYKMHLFCTGQGSPTIVAESGSGDDFTSWSTVQSRLSGSTRFCSYDRAGFGWSDAQPGPRDAQTITRQLHGLLTVAGITGPVVLIGHSYGGLLIPVYTAAYPQQVKGLVFIDAASPNLFEAPLADRMPFARQIAIVKGPDPLEQIYWAAGWERLHGHCVQSDRAQPDQKGLAKADECFVSQYNEAMNEIRDMQTTVEQARAAGPFPRLPIVIISEDGSPIGRSEQARADWDTAQTSLSRISPRSRRVVAKNSGHFIQVDRPDVVVQEMLSLIGEIRDGNG